VETIVCIPGWLQCSAYADLPSALARHFAQARVSAGRDVSSPHAWGLTRLSHPSTMAAPMSDLRIVTREDHEASLAALAAHVRG